MSRRQREGKYAGCVEGRHYRSRGVNCMTSRLDVCVELNMRSYRKFAPLFDDLLAAFLKGSL